MDRLHPWDGHHILKQQSLTVKAPRASPSLNLVGCQGDPHSDSDTGVVALWEITSRVIKPAQWHPHSCHSSQREWLSFMGL